MGRLDGLEEFICYDQFWLKKDMENMGYLFEFCDQYCRGHCMDIDNFYDRVKEALV